MGDHTGRENTLEFEEFGLAQDKRFWNSDFLKENSWKQQTFLPEDWVFEAPVT